MRVQRSGNADAHAVAARRLGEVRGGGEHAGVYQGLEVLVDHVADIVVAGVDHVDLFLLYIETDDFEAGLGLFHGQGQAYIAQSDNAQSRLTGKQFVLKTAHNAKLFLSK